MFEATSRDVERAKDSMGRGGGGFGGGFGGGYGGGSSYYGGRDAMGSYGGYGGRSYDDRDSRDSRRRRGPTVHLRGLPYRVSEREIADWLTEAADPVEVIINMGRSAAGAKAGAEEGEKVGATEAERIGGDEGEKIGREIAGDEVRRNYSHFKYTMNCIKLHFLTIYFRRVPSLAVSLELPQPSWPEPRLA